MSTPPHPPPHPPVGRPGGPVPAAGAPAPAPGRPRSIGLLLVGLAGGLLLLSTIVAVTVAAATGALVRPVVAGPQLAPQIERVLSVDYQRGPAPVVCPASIPATPGVAASCRTATGATVGLQVQPGGQVLVLAPRP